MKKLIITSILALLTTVVSTGARQDWPDEYLGLPGDNLNLYAVMNLFQQSETLEGFERSLNDESSRINNLDLNGDNLVDYIMVEDFVRGKVHTIVLRVALDRNETQDVAVFTVEKFRDGTVQIQLVGDEALYGKNYIIEPIYDDQYAETPNPGYIGVAGNARRVVPVRTTTIHISAWPLISYIYLPDYIAWRSRWYWGYWPSYWYAWRPYYWHYYYGYHSHWYPHYYAHYRHWNHFRFPHHHRHYCTNIRTFSPQVNIWINKGNYKNTYSKPELRKEGEALYSRTVSGQRPERQRVSGVNNRTESSQARLNASAGGGRRDVSASTSRQRTVASVASPNAETRRSSTNVDKGNSRSATRINGSTAARSSSPVTAKSTTRSSATTARSSSAVTAKSTTRSPGNTQSVSRPRNGSSPAVTNRTVVRSGSVTSSGSANSGSSEVRSSGYKGRNTSPPATRESSSRSPNLKSASSSQRSGSISSGRSSSRSTAVHSTPSSGRSQAGSSSARTSVSSGQMARSSGHASAGSRSGGGSGPSTSGRSSRR